MHLETGPHSILCNSLFVCFSATCTCAEPRPDSTNRHSPSRKAAVLAANPFLMTKHQICANSPCYMTSRLAFRKTELCAVEGSSGSGFALAAMPTSASPPLKLTPCCFPNLAKSSTTLSPAHATVLCKETQHSRTGPCQAENSLCLFSVDISQVAGNNLAICSKADRCSQLDNSSLPSSDIGTSSRSEEAYAGRTTPR